MSITDWGWSSAWAERFVAHREAGLRPARVAGVHRGAYELETGAGRVRGELSGRLEYAADSPQDVPVPGDWVAVTETDPALIVAVVERGTLITRAGEAGRTQPLAANVDVALIVSGLDRDWNPRRLDRYLVLAREGGAAPLIVLNKRDLCADPEAALRRARAVGPAVLVSALRDDLGALLGSSVSPGQTAALLGSSGAGKSTIVNALFGEAAQRAGAVRQSDSRGRHTTTARTLFRMPQGWLLLDMPGLRAVGVTGSREAVDGAFGDIAALAGACRFTDCAHEGEPGCAVRDAVDPQRLEHYRKLLREAAWQHRREDAAAARVEKEKWKAIHRELRRRPGKRD